MSETNRPKGDYGKCLRDGGEHDWVFIDPEPRNDDYSGKPYWQCFKCNMWVVKV